ncbi:serine/threonine-protein kinase [Anaeromyxobacter oryzae]|uniref:Protein kinase domain-containing protein n=1 Tax=Anaeromyxobacter oryzae TaxID=2918170 RepID=A0ABM7WRI7_9BACT|nr:serine/threonine-protein kinase [Anaeromyxobacter oryzae]BDG02070.1 hypothetical protein AMOR_10660 [Anaeromyxobacter oryzae]
MQDRGAGDDPTPDPGAPRPDAAAAGPDPAATSPARTLFFGAGAPPAGATDPLLGTRVGSFEIVRLLGRGGMGTVYLGEHPAIGSKVAIKFLHESMASDAQAVTRFFDEARAVNLIGHENIVAIYDLSLLPPNRHYFVMELLEGESLAARLRRGRVAPDVALDVLLQLCDALQCAHERGVVHRDLKPENVFLVPRRGKTHFVKLLDFGIAKLRGAAGGRTQAGLLVGTPEYMAPEQCDDAPVDARTDVYALGVIAFELATGRLPFEGRSVTQLLLAHLQKPPPRPSDLAPVHPALETAILRALEKAPPDRFQDMGSFADALRAAGEAISATSTSPSVRPEPFDSGASRLRSRQAESKGAPAVLVPPPPPPARPDARDLPDLTAELLAPGAAARPLAVVELTRAGLFLRADRELPPVRARVSLAVAHPSLARPLRVTGEVVRRVSPEDAAAAGMPAGFAVQLIEASPEARAAMSALADAARPRSAAAPLRDPAALLDAVLARAGAGPYALLGVPPDAELAEVRRAGRALREALEAVRAAPRSADQPACAQAALARLDDALAAVGAPAPRLAHDARTGNWRGVARCLAAGVPEALADARRRELLAAEPARAAEAQRQLARARVARKLGNHGPARAAYEAALTADPLDRVAREEYEAFVG